MNGHAADCPSRDGFYPENCECGYQPPYVVEEGEIILENSGDSASIEDDLDDCASEGTVFYPGDEAALTQSLDDYLTRTPPHPDDGDMLQDWVDEVAEEGKRLENLRAAHREPGTAERIDNSDGRLTL